MPENATAERTSTTARLFVALWPDSRTRRALAAWRDACAWPPGAKPVPDEKLHLTLHFIGAAPQARVAEIARALSPPIATPELLPVLQLQLVRVAAWPHGLVVLEPLTVPDRLRSLHDGLVATLHALGLPVERRRFRPHVTLARDAAAARWPAAHPVLTWHAASPVLVQSMPDGRYRVLRARSRR